MFVKGAVRGVFWVSLGATAGVLVFRQVTKAAKELTPAGIADRVTTSGGSLTDSVKSFWEDVKDAMHDREEELNVALGIDVTPTSSALHVDTKSVDKSGTTSESNGSSKNARATTGRSSDDA